MTSNKHRDVVSPFVFGYSTPFFLGNEAHKANLRPRKYCLKSKICASVFESGSIFFDFGRCEEAPVVIHRESLWNNVEPDENGTFRDDRVSRCLRRTESRQRLNQSFYRSVLLAHVLLLENAGRLIGGASFHLPRIEIIHGALSRYDIPESFSNDCVKTREGLRLSANVIDRSFSDLDLALTTDSRALLRVLELHKLSHYRTLDQRFAESLVLSWTVCENMIDFLWKRMIDDIKSSSKSRMVARRSKKLRESTTFTASIRIETLELAGHLSIEQANDLNKIRRARNKWLHSLDDVDEQTSLHSIGTCAHLISSVFGIEICDKIVSGAGGEGGGIYLDLFLEKFPDFDLSKAYTGDASCNSSESCEP